MLGHEVEPISDANAVAILVWNALANGMGGLDWAGLDIQVALHGIEDVEALCDALLVIKTRRHRKDEDGAPPAAPPAADLSTETL